MKAGVYRHYKGGYYLVLGIARNSTNNDTIDRGMKRYVVYVGLTEKSGPRMFVREIKEFEERTANDVPRFSYVGQEIP